MYLKICAALALIQIASGTALAVDDKKTTTPPSGGPPCISSARSERMPSSPPSGGFLQGTPEEQAACAPDSTKFCRDFIPDSLRVLACLQEHRKSLRRVCLKVLEDHGQ